MNAKQRSVLLWDGVVIAMDHKDRSRREAVNLIEDQLIVSLDVRELVIEELRQVVRRIIRSA